MTSDLPPDTARRLRRLLTEAEDAAEDRRPGEARDLLDATRELVDDEAADGDIGARLIYGCDRAADLLDDEPLVAAEYLRAMRDMVD